MPSMIYNTRAAQRTGVKLAPGVISYTRMLIITVRNSSYAKVMFSQARVKNSVRGGGGVWQGACMAGGVCGRGICVVGEWACMARWACMAGGAHGRGHAW